MSEIPPPPPPPPPMSPPPGYVAYGGEGAYGGAFQRIGGLTKALVTLSVISIVAAAINVVVQGTLRGKALDFRDGTMTIDEFADKLGPYLAVTALAGFVFIGMLVVQIIWTFRIAKNVRLLGRQTSFSPGATIAINILGGCTLGILPYFMWRELWKGSDPTVAPGDPSWKQRPVSPIVHLWLASTLVTVIATIILNAGNAFVQFNRGSDETLAKQLDDRFAGVVMTGVLSVITAVIFLGLIRQLSARHMQATREV